jgi:hypothetical protein
VNLDQAAGDRGTVPVAVGVHHVDDDLPAFDEILIEADLGAFVREQLHVGNQVRTAAGLRTRRRGADAGEAGEQFAPLDWSSH